MEEAAYVKEILIGDCLTKDEAEDILRKDANLQELLADAQLRSEQHRYDPSCQTWGLSMHFQRKLYKTENTAWKSFPPTESHGIRTW